MNATRYLLILIHSVMALAWTGTAATAAVIVAKVPTAIEWDPLLMFLCSAISTLAGGTALAIRINTLLMATPELPLVRPWLFATAHMGGSWMAGVMAFLMARANDWNVWTLLLGVLLCSFLGAKAIEMVAERWLAVVRLPGVEVKP